MNQLHGRIDIEFQVKGNARQATMKFRSFRKGGRQGMFETEEWSLVGPDGEKIDLLDRGDVFKGIIDAEDQQEKKQPGRGVYRPNLS